MPDVPLDLAASSLSLSLSCSPALLGSRDDDEFSMITNGQVTKLQCTTQQETSPAANPEPLTQTSANRRRQPWGKRRIREGMKVSRTFYGGFRKGWTSGWQQHAYSSVIHVLQIGVFLLTLVAFSTRNDFNRYVTTSFCIQKLVFGILSCKNLFKWKKVQSTCSKSHAAV
jgi:hypothetical protein